MAGNRELGEVHSHPVDSSFTADDSGYVYEPEQGGNGYVQKADSANSTNLVGVGFTSTEDQHGDVVTPSSGEYGLVEEGVMMVKCDAAEYFLGEDVYVSSSNNGHANKSDTGNRRLGRVHEYTDNSGGSDGDKVPIKFDTA